MGYQDETFDCLDERFVTWMVAIIDWLSVAAAFLSAHSLYLHCNSIQFVVLRRSVVFTRCRALKTEEMKDFCLLLFGQENADDIPNPVEDWEGFEKVCNRLMGKEGMTWVSCRRNERFCNAIAPFYVLTAD